MLHKSCSSWLFFVSNIGLDETCLQSDDDSYRQAANVAGSYDEMLFHRLRNSLSGIPPPPLVTYPQQNVDDILSAMRIIESMTEPAQDSPCDNLLTTLRLFTQQQIPKTNTFLKTLHLNSYENRRDCKERNSHSEINDEVSCEDIENSSYDGQLEISSIEMKCKFYDIGYNMNELCEKNAQLYDKYRERYVGCETSSFVTANSPSKYFGKKKEKRKMIVGRSPARRAAFQKTRRKMFTSASLEAANRNCFFGVEKRTILIDTAFKSKKKDDKQIRRALFVSPEERRSAKAADAVKPSPGRVKAMEMRRSLWMRRKLVKRSTPGKQTPKKYAGTTPSKRTPRKDGGGGGGSASKPTSRRYGTPAKSTPRKSGTPRKYVSTRRSSGSAKKRLERARSSGGGVEGAADCANGERQLAADATTSGQRLPTASAGEHDLKLENPLELSDTQRRKLLWAVSESLKHAGIGNAHKNFRLCGRKLYKLCKSFWTSNPAHKNLKMGISELMRSLATEHVENVIKEVEDQTCQSSSLELCSQDSNSCDFFFQS